jgi:hypothetical protein
MDDNIQTVLIKIWCECVNWIELAEDGIQFCTFVKTVMKFSVL